MTTQMERIENELRLNGFNLEPVNEIKSDDDYAQSIGTIVYNTCKYFSEQDMSGYAASQAIQMITLLLKGKPLSPLTNNPKEWSNEFSIDKDRYQSKRDFSCFSNDELKTYYDIDEEANRDFELDENGKRTGWSSIKPKDQIVYHKLKDYKKVEEKV